MSLQQDPNMAPYRALLSRLPHAHSAVVKSLGEWAGAPPLRPECSVYGETLRCIDEAEHFVWLENQYVLSSLAGEGVENKVLRAVLQRLRRAMRRKETFRVYVLVPFPEETDAQLRTLVRYENRSLVWGPFSIAGRLKAEFPEVELRDYFIVMRARCFQKVDAGREGGEGMRRHPSAVPWSAGGDVPEMDGVNGPQGSSSDGHDARAARLREAKEGGGTGGGASGGEGGGRGGRYFSGQLFVHSKMILADDRVAVVASANINDRSLHGERDTELGVVLRSEHLRPGRAVLRPGDAERAALEVMASTMGGHPYHVSRVVHALRTRLWREWLGLACDDDAQVARVLLSSRRAEREPYSAGGVLAGEGTDDGAALGSLGPRLPQVLPLDDRTRLDGPGGPGAELRPLGVADTRSALVARSDEIIRDASAQEVFHGIVRASAVGNRVAMERAFADTPRDSVGSAADHAALIEAAACAEGGTVLSREQELDLVGSVRGYLVTMSEGYLGKEDLAVQLSDPEMVVPAYMMQ